MNLLTCFMSGPAEREGRSPPGRVLFWIIVVLDLGYGGQGDAVTRTRGWAEAALAALPGHEDQPEVDAELATASAVTSTMTSANA